MKHELNPRPVISLAVPGLLVLGACVTPAATPAASVAPAKTVASTPAASAPGAAPAATTIGGALTPTPTSRATIRWLGHSSFLLTTAKGTKILMDPSPAGYGYEGPPLPGVDAITTTHEHSDHTNVGMAAGSPLVIRGLVGGDWAKIDQKVKEVAIRNVASYHDPTQGSQRGKNSIFLFETDGIRVAHLGDLGHILTAEQVAALTPVDILIIPVGGFYTVDAGQATEVLRQLESPVVIPMHYKTPKLRPDWPGVGIDDFLKGKTVQQINGNTFTFSRETLPRSTTVVVLSYE